MKFSKPYFISILCFLVILNLYALFIDLSTPSNEYKITHAGHSGITVREQHDSNKTVTKKEVHTAPNGSIER